MSSISLDADDGYVAVQTPDGQELTFDLFKVSSQLREFWRDQVERNVPDSLALDALVDLLCTWGLPPLSQRLALRLNDQIVELANEAKKKDSPAPEPAASTASTFSIPQ